MEVQNFPKIIVIMRIKNEERWINLVFDSISEICSGIIVLDGNSTDKTISICEKHKKVIKILHQKDSTFDETRDKNDLLNEAMKHNPDFILTLDGDQVLQPQAKDILFEELMILFPENSVFELQELSMYDNPNQYRYDGYFSNCWTKKIIRMNTQPKDLHFKGNEYPGNAHCPSIPQTSKDFDNPVRSRIKILHYGNYDKNLRNQKYDFNTNLDPNNTTFDGYVHIISDKGKFSGKMGYEFRTLPKGMYISNIV